MIARLQFYGVYESVIQYACTLGRLVSDAEVLEKAGVGGGGAMRAREGQESPCKEQHSNGHVSLLSPR